MATIAGLEDAGEFHTQRNTLFTYIHVSDSVTLVIGPLKRILTATSASGYSIPDTSAETPSHRITAECVPTADVRDGLCEDDYATLVDTTTAETLFD
ncbi:hypothetical protein [Natrinema sp. SYSU A 869]|uniref:hypothetical protein n=1 Tax=Natrinema sp. SYSU A 869 TaxID=2871694 RepID=UPI001CA3AFD9|nr:hypothetical protein [Natrinema sp. SYSU A 869]